MRRAYKEGLKGAANTRFNDKEERNNSVDLGQRIDER
jgi:hypothetical protein